MPSVKNLKKVQASVHQSSRNLVEITELPTILGLLVQFHPNFNRSQTALILYFLLH